MRRFLWMLPCCCLVTSLAHGDEPLAPDGTPWRVQRGLIVARQGDQTVWSLGGVFCPRKIKVVTATPEGPVVTRFILPSVFHSPSELGIPTAAPALLKVSIPDVDGILYVEGELVRGDGTLRQLQSPSLLLGKPYPLHLRAAFKVGDQLLIEDKQVLIRAAETTSVTFDGSRAISVPLRENATEVAPFPRRVME